MAESERSINNADRIIGGIKDGFEIDIFEILSVVQYLKTYLRPKLVPGHGSFRLLKRVWEYVLEVLSTIDGS